jgi:peptidyl-prolyl cis-trans isomerase C
MAIRVNAVEISEREIAREAQHHTAASLEAARAAAARALVVRELLLQAAARRGIDAAPALDVAGGREVPEEATIRALVEQEIDVPKADEATCRRFFEHNRDRFRSPDLFEARHILFMALPDDPDAQDAAREKAVVAIEQLQEHPDRFPQMAQALSDCPSAKEGGNLGQITRGSTVPEIETFLYNLEVGQLCPVPIKSRYGYHVLRLERRVEGRALPFEAVHAKIADYLEERAWAHAVRQFIGLLAGDAMIEGIDIDAATSPLVQ